LDDDENELADYPDFQVSALTAACVVYSGVSEPDPKIKYTPASTGLEGEYHLSYVNDLLELSFTEIANLIEADENI
jgi:hypothetical protein